MTATSTMLTTPIFLTGVPCLAAPAPFPPQWILDITNVLKTTGKLTQTDINNLIKKFNGSYTRLLSIINRINSLLVARGISYRLRFQLLIKGADGSLELPIVHQVGATYIFQLIVVETALGKEVATYDLGTGTYDAKD